jgi:hypothetical protein
MFVVGISECEVANRGQDVGTVGASVMEDLDIVLICLFYRADAQQFATSAGNVPIPPSCRLPDARAGIVPLA